jgi:hypothetical protein
MLTKALFPDLWNRKQQNQEIEVGAVFSKRLFLRFSRLFFLKEKSRHLSIKNLCFAVANEQ